MPQKTKYDWVAIESEYRTGTFSDAELSRKYGCSRTAIQKHAKKDGWSRDLSPLVRRSLNKKLIEEDAKVASEVAGCNVDDDESVERAAGTRFNVVACHRKDIKALRELETKLIAELDGNPTKLYITQYQGEIVEKEVGLTAAERAQAANNLANVQHKRIALERQAYNLDERSGEESIEDLIRRVNGKG
jgi:hypothetical protein